MSKTPSTRKRVEETPVEREWGGKHRKLFFANLRGQIREKTIDKRLKKRGGNKTELREGTLEKRKEKGEISSREESITCREIQSRFCFELSMDDAQWAEAHKSPISAAGARFFNVGGNLFTVQHRREQGKKKKSGGDSQTKNSKVEDRRWGSRKRS